ncbi:MAG: monovalent cation/H+ antiporter complex subunit F [candidate division WOR-3 bacterium]|uniref:Cation:proton antiporter n=1 Tax=candidate division WOR-3 bacterium TaxID=2052148 RepID=A0A7C1NTL6_UNCW3|nr:monovalent cation/H+ antiporter complex subunit F [candidate division WOR-3 bacterium]
MVPVIILVPAALFCLYRALVGPSIADRAIAVDMMGVVFSAITALVALQYKLSYLLDISIALAIISFVGALALAKFLEKRSLDD